MERRGGGGHSWGPQTSNPGAPLIFSLTIWRRKVSWAGNNVSKGYPRLSGMLARLVLTFDNPIFLMRTLRL